MGTIKSMAQAFALKEARAILKASIRPGAVIWRRHIRYDWQTHFKHPVIVELLPSLELRVTIPKTGEILAQGPAWVEGDRFSIEP